MIAPELRDGAGENLTKSVMYFAEYERCRDDQPEAARPLFQKGIELLRKGLDELRVLIQGLHQANSDATLKSAVQELLDEFEGK